MSSNLNKSHRSPGRVVPWDCSDECSVNACFFFPCHFQLQNLVPWSCYYYFDQGFMKYLIRTRLIILLLLYLKNGFMVTNIKVEEEEPSLRNRSLNQIRLDFPLPLPYMLLYSRPTDSSVNITKEGVGW